MQELLNLQLSSDLVMLELLDEEKFYLHEIYTFSLNYFNNKFNCYIRKVFQDKDQFDTNNVQKLREESNRSENIRRISCKIMEQAQ